MQIECMKPIILSRHCKEEMIIRSITKEDIEKAIISPDKTKKDGNNATVVWKKINNDGLKVIYIEQEKRIFVITAYPKLSI